MDPVGPWSAYASYNRLAGVQAGATGGDLHHLSAGGTAGTASTTASAAAQLLPGGFLSPSPVGYETVFTNLFHGKPTPHYVAQHRQALAQAQAQAASKQAADEHHQSFFDQNAGWQQNSPFGILPHESVVAASSTAAGNFNAHFAVQSISHLNSVAAKNVTARSQSPQVPSTFPTSDAQSTVAKPYTTTNAANLQQQSSCIVTASNASVPSVNVSSKEYRVPHAPNRTAFLATTNARQAPVVAKQVPPKQAERQRSADEQTATQSSPISFSIMDTSRLNYVNGATNAANKRAFQNNYRHFQQGPNPDADFQRSPAVASTNGAPPDCSVVVPRRPSPLQAHSQPSPLGHTPSPAYPLYNSPMNQTISSPQGNQQQVTPPSPLDASVPRPNAQTNVAYSSVITRTLNNDKVYQERFERPSQNQNCWEDRRKYPNSYGAGNSIEIPSRQIDVPNRLEAPQRQATIVPINERQQPYFDANHQVTLQDLSSCRGDPMSLVKNLQQQQQQSCLVQQVEVKQEIKPMMKRRKSNEKVVSDMTGRIPPPAHSTGVNQQPQNGTYFDFDRWNLPPPPSKIFASQSIQQHQGLMVPHPHTHHPPPPIPYFPSFHIPPHPTEFSSSMELAPMNPYNEQPAQQPTQYHQQSQPPQQQQQQPPAEDHPKVVVPNIEEELNFLSDPTRVAAPKPPKQNNPVPPPPTPMTKPPDKSGVGFMSSYIKFLQGERDASPPPARGGRKQTWTQPKVEERPESNGVIQTAPPQLPPPPPPAPLVRLSKGDPQDDPRYFPLPKERKKNSFDSSDDGLSSDDDLFKKTATGKETAKEKSAKKGRPCKPGGPTERRKARQLARLKKSKAAVDDGTPVPSEIFLQNVPRRETSKRAAKEKVQSLIRAEDVLEETNDFVDSDSDPAWTPAAKDEGEDDSSTLKKGKRIRQSTRRKGRSLSSTERDSIPSSEISADAKKHRIKPNKQGIGGTAPTLEDNIEAAVAQQEDAKVNCNTAEDQSPKTSRLKEKHQQGEFVVIRSELKEEWPALWRVDGKSLLQKCEPFEQNGQTLYRNSSTYTSWTPENRNQYVTVPVRYRSQTSTDIVVEFLRADMIDPDFMDYSVKDLEKFRDNFEVYIQTLISQALDSNFLREIFQEQDDYFLSNVKIIDDVTASKKHKLTGSLRWPVTVQAAVLTWPCFNVIRELSAGDVQSRTCAACGSPGVAVRVLMYGQPYNVTTLEGCQPDPRAINEKDIIMCQKCASRVELINKITHQKYLMYIECAKKVADKRAADRQKDTTCILNELLADEKWLNQLFSQVRNSWAEADYIEYSLTRRTQ